MGRKSITMLILNFAYPIKPEQRKKIEEITGQTKIQVRDVPVEFEHERAFGEQARVIVDSIGLTPNEWQTLPILINLPSLNFGAVTVLVELHGRMGYFPSILRTRPVNNGGLTQYEVAEVINLQTLRGTTRAERR